MLPDRVSNPGPLTYESGALPIALRGPATFVWLVVILVPCQKHQNVITSVWLVVMLVPCQKH